MGCDENISPISSDLPISIHASRMGCDGPVLRCGEHDFYFNPRIPYGMRLQVLEAEIDKRQFQSTHPVWDATLSSSPLAPSGNFNPRIPYGMRPPERRWSPARSYHFNPRIPYGMRQSGVNKWTKAVSISIHASRMGCDMRRHPAPFGCRNFNPRIPYGMRPDC